MFIGYVSKPLWEEPIQQLIPSSAKDSVHSAIDNGTDYINNNFSLDKLNHQLNSLFTTPDNPS